MRRRTNSRRAFMRGECIRTGAWITPTRLRVYPLVYLGVLVTFVAMAITFGHGVLDAFGHPLGTDFVHLWSASSLLWQGQPAAAYDNAALHAMEQSVAGPDCPLYTWLYPPMALLVVAPLAAMPYLWALTVWLTVTFVGYLSALWRLLPDRRALLPMVAFAPVFINLGHGQNAFLSAALLGWGLILLPGRPWLAGALMGALIYKPQLGLLLPVALLAAGSRRALLGAGLSAVALALLSYALFGAEVWAAFFVKSAYSRLVLEQGLVPWQKMISGFAAARMLGAPIGLAWALQALISLAVGTAVWWVWRGPAPYRVKCAALVAGTLLVTPYAFDYEATMVGIALVLLVADGLRRGFLEWEISALALVWMSPLFWRPLAVATDIPLGLATVMLLLWLAVRRARLAGRQEGRPQCESADAARAVRRARSAWS